MGRYDHLIEFLPQLPPALYVDEVTELHTGESVEGRVTFPTGHRVFAGHLPDEPLVPGVILIEAMAQIAGIALMGEGGRAIRGYLGEVRHMRFRKTVGPDETVTLAARLEQQFGGVYRFETTASSGGDLVATGEITVVAAAARPAPRDAPAER